MSRRRVITGADERGRPVARWEDVPVDPPAYGHMVPAYSTAVDRRQATDEQRAQWATDDRPKPAAAPKPTGPPKDRYTADDLQARRQRGQAAMRAAIAPKEPTVTEPVSSPAVDVDDLAPSAFTDIAAAAMEAAKAHQEAEAAREAVRVAEEHLRAATVALESAWTDAGLTGPLLEPVPTPTVAITPVTHPTAVPVPGRSKRGTKDDQGKAERARRAVEALERHGGDKRAAAAELGIKANALAMIVKHAAGKVAPTVAA